MHRNFQCCASVGLVTLLDGPSGDSCPVTDHGEPCARNRSLADRGHNSRSKIKQLAHVHTNRETDTANRASNENNGKKPYIIAVKPSFSLSVLQNTSAEENINHRIPR